MKNQSFILALAACVFLLAQSGFALAWSFPGQQSDLAQEYSTAQVSDVDPLEMQQPQGGVRSFLPLFFLVIIYIVIRRMFRNMHRGDDSPFGSGRDFDGRSGPGGRENDPEHLKDAYDNARRMWDMFSGRPGDDPHGQHDDKTGESRDVPQPGKDVPAGEPRPVTGTDKSASRPGKVISMPQSKTAPGASIDASAAAPGTEEDDEFLMGARLVFERMVEAMDGLDLDTAAHFAGPAVLNDIKYRLNEGHPPAMSEVVRVDAKVLSRTIENDTATVTVYYDGLKKVAGIGPIQMRQVWTFTKDENDPAAMWMLQSMEPVEA